ncbi:MAG: hypothetical protein IH934_06360 [Nanoarchaeota archaeon]|nr:hypothetical protein [Nanoarchaeota archaeon]
MSNIEDIANDPEWQPSSVICAPIQPPSYFDRVSDIVVVVKQLNNGLLYAIPQNKSGKTLFKNASYSVGSVPVLNDQYKIINLAKRQTRERPGFFATFEYETGETPDGNNAARIEYTTWHNPIIGENGLTALISLYAWQENDNGKLELHLNVASNNPADRSMRMKIFPPDEFGGHLDFDKEGVLLKAPFGFYEAGENPTNPLRNIYLATLMDSKVDVLHTAMALVKGFPNQPIEQLVQYK